MTPPTVTLSGSRLQKLAPTVFVNVLCRSEACRATVSGSVRVARVVAVGARTHRLKAVNRQLTRARTTRIAIKVPAATRIAIARALKARKRTVVTLRIRAVDAAGNARTLTRSVRLKR